MPSLLCRCKSFQSESSLLNWPSSDLTALWVHDQFEKYQSMPKLSLIMFIMMYGLYIANLDIRYSQASLSLSVELTMNEKFVLWSPPFTLTVIVVVGEPLTGHLTNNLELSVILSIQAVRKILSKPFPSGGNSTVNSNLSNFWWPGPTLTQTASQQAGKVDNPNLSGPQSFLLTPVSKFVNCLFVNKKPQALVTEQWSIPNRTSLGNTRPKSAGFHSSRL